MSELDKVYEHGGSDIKGDIERAARFSIGRRNRLREEFTYRLREREKDTLTLLGIDENSAGILTENLSLPVLSYLGWMHAIENAPEDSPSRNNYKIQADSSFGLFSETETDALARFRAGVAQKMTEVTGKAA